MNSLVEIIEKEIQLCPGRVSVQLEIGDWCYEHDGERVYSSASLIKVPILIEAFRQHEKGLIGFHNSVEINQEQRVGGSGVIQAVQQSNWTIMDLMTLMIIVSDNTATNALIDLLGMDSINECMKELQLKSTQLQRKMMDFAAIQEGKNNYTCAADMIQCLKVMDLGGFLTEESCSASKSIMQHQQFNNRILGLLDPDTTYMGSKSGSLQGIEHDCAIIKYHGKTAYIAVLIDQVPEGKTGTSTMQEIGRAVYEELIKREI